MTSFPPVYLIRHGETAWSLSGRHTGNTDIPLTGQGERQSLMLGERLRGQTFSLVLTSPLQRARRTCELAGFGGSARVEPDLREWDYGSYEGMRTADIRDQRPGWRLFEDGCPAGETADDVGLRADRVIDRIRGQNGVLLFAHGHVLRVIAARWLGFAAVEGRRFLLSPATLCVLGYDHDMEEPVIRTWNEALEPDVQA